MSGTEISVYVRRETNILINQRVIEGSDFLVGTFNFAVEDTRVDTALTL